MQAQEPENAIDHTTTTDPNIALFDQEVSLKTNANSMAMVDYGNQALAQAATDQASKRSSKQRLDRAEAGGTTPNQGGRASVGNNLGVPRPKAMAQTQH